MKKYALTLLMLAIIAVSPAGISAQQTDHSVRHPTQTWDYDGYSVYKIDTGDKYSAFEQLPFGNHFKRQGILPFAGRVSGTDRFELMILRANEKSAVATGYKLPTFDICYVCATSKGKAVHPTMHIYNDEIVVKKDDDWYLFDPLTFESTLILTREDIPNGKYKDFSYGFDRYRVGVEKQENCSLSPRHAITKNTWGQSWCLRI